MITIADRLDAILAELTRLACPVVELLEPPQTSISLPRNGLPSQLVEYFTWRGGTSPVSSGTVSSGFFIPGYWYPTYSEALSVKDAIGELGIGGDWIPILVSAGGDVYAAVWDPGDQAVRVAGFLVGEQTEIEFSSLVDFLDVCIAAFRNGAFFVDDDGVLAMDPDRYDQTVDDFG